MKAWASDLCKGMRATAVLVGTLIGAGYATGREVSQYFGRASVLTVVLAALAIALLSVLFLYVGMRAGEPKGKWLQVYRTLLSLAAVASCGVMIAAGRALLGGVWTPLILGAIGVVLSATDRLFHGANLVAVPLLVILVLSALSDADPTPLGSGFLVGNALNYAGMNLLFEGELLRKEGRDMTPRAILIAGIAITGVMTFLLLAMRSMVGDSPSALPFAKVCIAQGKEVVVKGVIVTAILTNIAGAMRLVPDGFACLSRGITLAAATTLSFVIGGFAFADLVRCVYPVMGWMGVAVGVIYLIWALSLHKKWVWRRHLPQKWRKRGIDSPRGMGYN